MMVMQVYSPQQIRRSRKAWSLAVLFKLACLAALLLWLNACARVSPIDRPEPNMAETWSTSSNPGKTVVDPFWWQHFGSAQLDQLIFEALQQSPDLAAMSQRVRQAELQVRSVGSSWFPTLNLTDNTGARRTESTEGIAQTSESTAANLAVNYEVDLWGGVAAGVRSAQAQYRATQYEAESLQLSIVGAVATAWFQLLALEERMRIAQDNIGLSERVMAVVDARYRNGAASAAEVARQRTSLLSQQSALLPLQLQHRQTRAALAVLLGAMPHELSLADEALLALQLPDIHAGVPSDLLLRRPDLARAEAQLQAADANLAVARSALLPRVTLGASGGLASAGIFALSPASQSVGWTLALAQNVFDGGRQRVQVALSESRQLELLEQYRRAILVAVQEAEDALARTEYQALQEDSQQEVLIQAERSLALTEIRYREGSEDLLALLDAQRSVFQTREQLLQLRLNRLVSKVDLYKALGGGWQYQPE